MNPFEMVVLIVIIVTIGKVFQSRFRHRQDLHEDPPSRFVDASPSSSAETARLKEELTQLKQRLHVLERIAVDKENSLAREIDQLRDR